MSNFDIYNLGLFENEYWESNWKEVISTDHHYDGDFLIRLMTHKLKLMFAYFSDKSRDIALGDLTTDNDIVNVIATLNNCYLLGMKILNYNYGEEADKLFQEKSNMIWLSGDFHSKDYDKWCKLTKQAEKARKKDIEEFFKLIAKNVDSWWI